MNYSLSSIRKIGKYSQVLTVTWDGAYSGDEAGMLTALQATLLEFKNLDSPSWKTGDIKYFNFCRSEGNEESNLGGRTEAYICGICTTNGKPQDFSFYVPLTGTLIDDIKTNVNTLLGISYPTANVYITNAVINKKI